MIFNIFRESHSKRGRKRMRTTFILPIHLASLWLWILGFLLFATGQVSAGTFDLTPDSDSRQKDLQQHCLLAENPILLDGQLDFQATSFTPIPEGFRFQPNQEYWLKLSLKSNHPNTSEQWVYLGQYNEVTLYRNQTFIGHTGKSINRQDCMHPVHRNWLSLMPLSKKPVDYYFRIKTGKLQKPTPLFAQLADLEELEQIKNTNLKNNFNFYFFRISILAIIAFMALLSLAHFFTNNDQAYRCYSFYLLLTFFYLLITFERGSSFSFFVQNHFAAHYQALVIPTLMLSYFFYTQFVRSILNTRAKYIHFDRLLQNYGLMTLVFVGIDLVSGSILNVDFYPHLRNMILTISFVMAMYIYFQIWKTKGIVAKLVLSGSIIFIIGSFISFLFSSFINLPQGLGIFSYPLTSMQISVLIEAIFFTIALAYRSRQIENEKAKAYANLITETYEKEKLVYQNEKSREFEERRSHFFANTNHELRSPLTVIKGMAESLDGNHLQRNIILKNTTNMLFLINNMLQLAKTESGDVKVNMLQDNFIKFCKSQIEGWTYFAKTKKIDVIYQPSADSILMDFDDQKMEQIISNLMSNAIKFTPPEGTVTVTTEVHNHQLVLTIQDTGNGIAEADLSRVFDRYYRAENPQNSQIIGTGIGLALVKKLVEIAHGTIDVSSQPGLGSTFVLHFPVTQSAPHKMANTTATFPIPIDVQDDLLTHDAPIDAPVLLLVEDNPEILTHLKYTLSQQYHILTATDGSSGISKARASFPDLIISDVRMPIQDGLSLCETLKKDLSTSHIPIILLTASSTEEDKIKGLERKADAYITKPFSQAELTLRIENLLQVKKTLHAYFSKDINSETIQKSEISKEDQYFLDKLANFIKDNIDDKQMDIQQMMLAVNVSRPTLHSKLKSLTGLSASQFKKQIKMQEAKRLLQTGHRNITDLAFQLGYKYPNNFSKDFKK